MGFFLYKKHMDFTMCFFAFKEVLMKGLIIAGVSSGVGKTTISIGIMRALKRRGRVVIPFKSGPDYIDTGFHHAATGRPSINLDLWMNGTYNTKFTYHLHAKEGDFSIIEGVMGLYDGLGDELSTGSTAHLSKIINAPVILIMDGSHLATSGAAVILGFKEYDKNVNIAGVIVNNVSSEHHFRLIEDAILRSTGIPCLGYLPHSPLISVPSRNLGLDTKKGLEETDGLIDGIATFIENHLDMDLLENIASTSKDEDLIIEDPRLPMENMCAGMKIGVARDDAFSFYYEDNIRLLQYMGFEILYFSPLKDTSLPKNLDAIYIGGGYPENYVRILSENKSFRTSIKDALMEGIPTYAESGGYMYLTEGIKDFDGRLHEMVGFFKGYTKMTKSLQRFGYAEVETDTGLKFRGHEFHHSAWVGDSTWPKSLSLSKPKELSRDITWTCGQRKDNAYGAYVQIHFYSNLDAVKEIAKDILEIKERSLKNETN